MFARKFRLPAQIPLDHAQIISSPVALIKIKANALSYNRYGFVISKKISKRAHIRNRTKRRLRACIEAMHKDLKQGYDMLFVLKANAVTTKTQELKGQVRNIFVQKKFVRE